MSELPSERVFVGTDFFTLAQDLATREDEAAQRSAVSRTYYAVFHAAQVVLEHHDPDYMAMRSHDSHKQVWDRLAALDRRQTKSAMRSCHSLLRERKAADYHVNAGDWPRRAAQAIETGDRALRALLSLLPNDPI